MEFITITFWIEHELTQKEKERFLLNSKHPGYSPEVNNYQLWICIVVVINMHCATPNLLWQRTRYSKHCAIMLNVSLLSDVGITSLLTHNMVVMVTKSKTCRYEVHSPEVVTSSNRLQNCSPIHVVSPPVHSLDFILKQKEMFYTRFFSINFWYLSWFRRKTS